MPESTAPAKIILLGEHAVVYHQPAIAIPVSSLRARAAIETAPSGAGLTIIARDLHQRYRLADSHSPLSLIARLVLEQTNRAEPDATITVTSAIPPASGLGSGAAVCTATARALAGYLGVTIANPDLNPLVYQTETLLHGTPSGLDNTVIVYESPVYFLRGQPIQTFSMAHTWHFVIADTGISASTRIAVGDVRHLHDAEPERIQPIIAHIGGLAQQAHLAIQNGDHAALGKLMTANHSALQQLTVSCPELDVLVDAAHAAGALGAKLSGGGRGGNMIALAQDKTHALALADYLLTAGARRTFITTLSGV